MASPWVAGVKVEEKKSKDMRMTMFEERYNNRSPATAPESLLGILASRINPQAHGYRCSFHPSVFHGIVSIEEREYTIYGFRQSKDTHIGVGRIGQRGLPLESMFRRRDHVAVILRAKGIDRLKQANRSNNSALSDIRM